VGVYAVDTQPQQIDPPLLELLGQSGEGTELACADGRAVGGMGEEDQPPVPVVQRQCVRRQ
jgi:hypothetical protein